MGRRRQASGHGARAQRQTAVAGATLVSIDESAVRIFPASSRS
jgi:hypothetical protein